ncbi:hypothetical protein Mapa_004442 [Marchantia paleacea]|nr:hypothetical protein Mapa_004442 [Marchantia paleacea]
MFHEHVDHLRHGRPFPRIHPKTRQSRLENIGNFFLVVLTHQLLIDQIQQLVVIAQRQGLQVSSDMNYRQIRG